MPAFTASGAVMSAFGIRVDDSRMDRFVIAAGNRYTGRDYAIEPDASAASYFWAASAIWRANCGSWVRPSKNCPTGCRR